MLVFDQERHYAVLAGYFKVIGSKRRGDVDNTGTVFRRDKIAQQYPKRRAVGLDIGHELFVFHAFQVSPFDFLDDFKIGNGFVARFDGIRFQGRVAVAEVGGKAVFREDYDDGLLGIAVEGADFDVGDMLPYRQGGVGRQRPGGSSPGQKKGIFTAFEAELGDRCRIGNIAIGTRLVQFVRTEARTGRRGERLYGIALVQQPFVIELAQ